MPGVVACLQGTTGSLVSHLKHVKHIRSLDARRKENLTKHKFVKHFKAKSFLFSFYFDLIFLLDKTFLRMFVPSRMPQVTLETLAYV